MANGSNGDERGSAHQAAQDPRVQAERVEERIHHEIAVALSQVDHLGEHQVCRTDLAMFQHDALGSASRARCEEHVTDVMRSDCGRALGAYDVVDLVGPIEERAERHRALGNVAAQHHDLVDIDRRFVTQQLHVVGVEEARHREDAPRLGAVQDVRGFLGFEPRVHGDEHPAHRVDGEGDDGPLRDVRRPDAHAVARLDAAGDQRASGGVHLSRKIRKGPTRVVVDEGQPFREPARRVVDQLRDGLPGCVAHPSRVHDA
ncbi:MAG: hypothetical protein U0W40_10915 [Acidimicrobiia bacterium]